MTMEGIVIIGGERMFLRDDGVEKMVVEEDNGGAAAARPEFCGGGESGSEFHFLS